MGEEEKEAFLGERILRVSAEGWAGVWDKAQWWSWRETEEQTVSQEKGAARGKTEIGGSITGVNAVL